MSEIKKINVDGTLYDLVSELGTLIVNYNGTTADQTFSTIRSEYLADSVVFVKYDNLIYNLAQCTSSAAVFSCSIVSSNEAYIKYVSVTSGNVWSKSTQNLTYTFTDSDTDGNIVISL